MKVYVRGLPASVTEDGLKEMFVEFGEVAGQKLVRKGDTGESLGYGFVEMPDREEAEKAITEMAGAEVQGRRLTVEEARSRRRGLRPSGGFGAGRRSGGRR